MTARLHRYVCISVDVFDSPWLCALTLPAQLAWVRLLIYAKTNGRAGVVKHLPPDRFAAKLDMPGAEADIASMYVAAVEDGAITIDAAAGSLTITNWSRFQDTRQGKSKGNGRVSTGTSGTSESTQTTRRLQTPDPSPHSGLGSTGSTQARGDAPAARSAKGGGGRSPGQNGDAREYELAAAWFSALSAKHQAALLSAHNHRQGDRGVYRVETRQEPYFAQVVRDLHREAQGVRS